MDDTQKLIEDIIKAIVHNPEAMEIKKDVDEMGVLFSIRVDRRDMGLIIGPKGSTVEAIKHLVRMFGYKTRSNISIKVDEPKQYGK